MKNSSTLELNSGNSETVAVYDVQASKTFWSNYFTNSNFEEQDDFVLESAYDLMGNPINTSLILYNTVED